jgi:chromosome segregation ATPase
MATNVVALTQLANLNDVETDIKNTIDALDRLQVLYATLATQRNNAANAFLRAFAADLAAIKGDPDKAFVDAQFAKFAAWKTGDDEIGKRIDALTAIGTGLKNRIVEFETAYRDQFIDLLMRQIAALNEQLDKHESDEDALKRRIKALNDELGRLLPAAAKARPAAAAKKAAKKI